MPARRRPPDPPDLNATLELLAVRIGDRIGESLSRALGRVAATAPADGPAVERQRCAREGCERPAAAKGLCKSHYNLMLYHRRKTEAAGRQTKRSTGRSPVRGRGARRPEPTK
jgi:hypothetical protein